MSIPGPEIHQVDGRRPDPIRHIGGTVTENLRLDPRMDEILGAVGL